MSFLIGVEIDNGRVVWIYDSGHPKQGLMKLTTVSDNQQKAEIKFFIKISGKKHLLCTENLNGIPRMPAGEPAIDIHPKVTGKTFQYQIYLNGKLEKQADYSLRRYLRSYKALFIAAVIIVIAGLTAAAVLFFPLGRKKIPAETTEKPQISAPERPKEVEPEPPVSIQQNETTEEIQETEKIEEPEQVVLIESEITDRHSVYFQPESDELTTDAVAGLKSFINNLPSGNDFEEGEFLLEVRGHCAYFGSEAGRAELSKARALRVYNFLKSEWGIEADSLVTGAGASQPVTLNRNEQYLNRRVDINIKGNIKKWETTK